MEQKNYKQIRIWGIIKDKEGNIMPNKSVKLMKKFKKGRRVAYQIMQEGVTSKQGIYSFNVEIDRISQYKVIVIDD